MKQYNKVTMKIQKALGLAISIAVLPASFFTFTSCEDYLTITPTSSIVEEEFWQDKNDLNNALFGCYKSMTGADFLTKVIYWGEMRSDDCERSAETGSTSAIANIMNANILPTYAIYDWTPMYKTINYCNKVLAHGPEVVATDESFSNQSWEPIKAEVMTIRALCYFYLVRSFGEVPYITDDINNNSQQLSYPQCTQLYILNQIIKDLEYAKTIAMSEYGNNVANKGRITKKAVYSILADVHLWRASYLQGKCHPFVNRLENEYAENPSTKNITDGETTNATAESDYKACIDYCDTVINMCYKDLNKKIKRNYPLYASIKPELGDLLAQHEPTTNLSISISSGSNNAFNKVFGTGNSDESIFELQFDGTSYGNDMTTTLFWNLRESKVASLTAPKTLFEDVASNPNVDVASSVFTKTDYRRWESLNRMEEDGQTDFNYTKFSKISLSQKNDKKNMLTDNTASRSSGSYPLKITSETFRSNGNNAANFIVYRLSEIFLMKAEAITQISSSQDDLMNAFNYVKEVYKRSNPYAYYKGNSTAGSDSLKTAMFMTPRAMEYLVMAERQREFLCEGKRWFDLVRFAQRRGNTEDMLALLVRKFSGNQKSVQAKLADMQSLFSPVYEEELKANYLLYQNGAWKASQTTGRTDNRK